MIKIAHISDLHYKKNPNTVNSIFKEVLTSIDDPLEQLSSTFENEDKDFDLLIVSGDICEQGSEDDYLFVKEYLREVFNCPIIVTSGNHDNRHNLNKAFFNKDNDSEVFEIIKTEDLKVISFDSSDKDHNDGYIPLNTIDRIDKELADNINTILFTHHHLLTEQFSMDKAINSSELLERVKKHDNVIAILTGHTHHYYHTQIDKIEYFTSKSMSFVIENKDKDFIYSQDSGANIYYYENGKIKSKKIDCPLKKGKLGMISF